MKPAVKLKRLLVGRVAHRVSTGDSAAARRQRIRPRTLQLYTFSSPLGDVKRYRAVLRSADAAAWPRGSGSTRSTDMALAVALTMRAISRSSRL